MVISSRGTEIIINSKAMEIITNSSKVMELELRVMEISSKYTEQINNLVGEISNKAMAIISNLVGETTNSNKDMELTNNKVMVISNKAMVINNQAGQIKTKVKDGVTNNLKIKVMEISSKIINPDGDLPPTLCNHHMVW